MMGERKGGAEGDRCRGFLNPLLLSVSWARATVRLMPDESGPDSQNPAGMAGASALEQGGSQVKSERDQGTLSTPSAARLPLLGKEKLSSSVEQNVPLVATMVIFGLVVIKVVTVSRFSLDIALALVHSAGPGAVLVGALVSLLPIIVFYFYLLVGSEIVGARRQKRKPRFLYWFGGLVALSFILLMSLLQVALIVVLLTAEWVYRRHDESKPVHTARGLLVSLLLIFLTAGQMWLPTEVVQSRNGTRIVGFVTHSDSTWTVVLTEKTTTLVTLRTPDVISRRVCHVQHSWAWVTGSIRDLIPAGKPLVPRCHGSVRDTARLSPTPSALTP
jgi:hypothetical protein